MVWVYGDGWMGMGDGGISHDFLVYTLCSVSVFLMIDGFTNRFFLFLFFFRFCALTFTRTVLSILCGEAE